MLLFNFELKFGGGGIIQNIFLEPIFVKKKSNYKDKLNGSLDKHMSHVSFTPDWKQLEVA